MRSRVPAFTFTLLCSSTASAQTIEQSGTNNTAFIIPGDHNTVNYNRAPPGPPPPDPATLHADARTRLLIVGLRGNFEAQSSSAMGASATVFAGLWIDTDRAADRSLTLRVEGRFSYGWAFGHYVMPDDSRASRARTVGVLDVGVEAAVGVHLRRRESWSVSIDAGVGVGGAIPLDVQRPDARETFAFPVTVRMRRDRVFLEVRPQLALRPSHDVRYTGFLAETAETSLNAAFVLEGGFGVAF